MDFAPSRREIHVYCQLWALAGLALSRDSHRPGWGAVYLPHTVVRKGGRAHTYGRLVRSVRRGRKVVQEAAHLGELDGEGRVRARRLVQAITGRTDQRELFAAPPPPRSTRSRSASIASAWSARGRSATCGWGGRCGGPCGSTNSAPRSCHAAAKRFPGRGWPRSR